MPAIVPIRPRMMTGETEIIFFDGDCGLCHATVRFVLRRDHRRRFCFSPLGSSTFMQTVSPEDRARLPRSVVVRTREGVLLTRSTAVVHILRQLDAPWPTVAGLLAIVPTGCCDLGYRCVTAIRRKLFKRPVAACPIVPREERRRFLP